MDTYFYISYLELDRNGEWVAIETDAYNIEIHTNRHDGLRLIRLIRDGYSDWVDMDNICDFKAELRLI